MLLVLGEFQQPHYSTRVVGMLYRLLLSDRAKVRSGTLSGLQIRINIL